LEKAAVPRFYFPPEGNAPQGVYEYIVRSGGVEPWNMTVALNKTIVDQQSGIGDALFQYQFGQPPPISSAPSPFPTIFTP
jgi:hypothetical protein